MSTMLTYVGLDVHKETIVFAVARDGRDAARELVTIRNDWPTLHKRLKQLGPVESLRVCYEAGPTGYGLHRRLTAEKIACEVVAPSLVPNQPGRRIKTDRRDAAKLAHFHRSGDLTPVYVPDEATEALRDLERARDGAKRAERAARHQLCKFLLRHDRRYDGGTSWTRRHLDWIRAQPFAHESQRLVLLDYLKTVEDCRERVDRLTDDIGRLVETSVLGPLIKALQAMRGVSLVNATVLAAEVGDYRRFPTARHFMSYVGLIPSEHSSGETKRRGGITRAGNSHVRRALIEAAWSYRFVPSMSVEIRRRNQGVSLEVRGIAWKAQKRLHDRYARLSHRGLNTNKMITALARELAGFVWAIARQETLLEPPGAPVPTMKDASQETCSPKNKRSRVIARKKKVET